MERLNPDSPSRKSKSMEEEKKLPPLSMDAIYDSSNHIFTPNKYNKHFYSLGIGEYRSLTEYDKSKNESAKMFI